MKINTKDFGEIEINKDDIVYFPNGIFAFEEYKEFIFIKKDDCMHQWLQNVSDTDPRFIVFKPNDLFSNYNPDIPPLILKQVGVKDKSNIDIFVIAVVPDDIKDLTVNLKSPIVVNFNNGLGMQIILENQNYSVRQRVFDTDEGRG